VCGGAAVGSYDVLRGLLQYIKIKGREGVMGNGY
jgi:hypothetical protein